MMQEIFNFDLRDDPDLVEELFERHLDRAKASYSADNPLAAQRSILKALNVVQMGNPVLLFVSNSTQAGERSDSITTEELWSAYEYEMNKQRHPMMSRGKFEKHLPDALLRVYGLSKSRNLVREIDSSGERTQRRGYIGLTLKPSPSR